MSISSNIEVSIPREYEKTEIENTLKDFETELIGLNPVKKKNSRNCSTFID